MMNVCQEKLSKRAVMKENKLGWMWTNTKEDLAREMTKSRSKTQTVTNGCVS